MLDKDKVFFQSISHYFQKSVKQDLVNVNGIVPEKNKYLTICRNFPGTEKTLYELSMTDKRARSTQDFNDYVKQFRDTIKSDAALTSEKSLVKIKFRGLGSEKPEAYLAKDDESLCAIKKFMEVYERFQRNHRTTLL